MIIPILLGLVVAAAIAKKKPERSQDPAVIATHRIVFQTLLDSKDVDSMHKMIPIYRENGFDAEADKLEQRIALHTRPPEVIQAHRAAYKKLMKCDDVDRVRNGAMAFESYGADKAAIALYERAAMLEKSAVEPNDEPERVAVMETENAPQLTEPIRNGLQYIEEYDKNIAVARGEDMANEQIASEQNASEEKAEVQTSAIPQSDSVEHEKEISP